MLKMFYRLLGSSMRKKALAPLKTSLRKQTDMTDYFTFFIVNFDDAGLSTSYNV